MDVQQPLTCSVTMLQIVFVQGLQKSTRCNAASFSKLILVKLQEFVFTFAQLSTHSTCLGCTWHNLGANACIDACREDIADHSNVFEFGDSGGILAMVSLPLQAVPVPPHCET